jgi:hypothetical protein
VIYYPKNPVFIQFDSSIMLGEPQWDEFMFLEAALKLYPLSFYHYLVSLWVLVYLSCFQVS